MNLFIGLLRAVNVGGTGKLPMSELRTLCEGLGFQDVATYIQSGNVVFRTQLSKARATEVLERALSQHMQTDAQVHLRTAPKLRAIVEAVPFDGAEPSQVLVLFLKAAPSSALLQTLTPPGREQVRVGKQELYVHFPDGIGRSKLRLARAKFGTGRNLNTLNRLLALADEAKR